MATIVKDLGAATAYGYAVEKGYTGTEEEFAELMASYASVAESAADSADAAAQSATNASNSAAAAATSASSASASATTASTKAGEAETSAAAADGSASAAAQSATSASGSATSASESASAAAQSATSASGSATSASGSATAAANSATAAAASEAAAKAVEESIPADYTDLSENVSELKSQIEEKLDTPAVAGTEGQVLGLNSSLAPVWVDQSGDVVTILGKNLINPKTLSVGRMSADGTISELNSYRTSDFIMLEPGTYSLGRVNIMTGDVEAPNYFGYGFYNLDKTFVENSRVYSQYTSAITLNVTVQNKCYIRVTGDRNYFEGYFSVSETGYMLCKGASLGAWEAYRAPKEYSTHVEESVDKALISVPGKNLYNKDECEHRDGVYFNSGNGQINSGDNYAIVGRIPVNENTQYVFSSSGSFVRANFYKSDGGYVHIASSSTGQNPFTTPEGCQYVGITIFNEAHTEQEYEAAIDSAQLEEGGTASTFEPYKEHRVYTIDATDEDAGKALTAKKVKNGQVTEWELRSDAKSFVETKSLVNVFDKRIAEDGKYFNYNYQTIYSSSAYSFSGLIPVKPNTHYNFSIQRGEVAGKIGASYQEWDSDGVYIQSTSGPQATAFLNQAITSENTHFISFNITYTGEHTEQEFNETIDTLMVVEGTQRPAVYVAYNEEPVVNHLKLDDMYRRNDDRFRGKKWLVTGTSVSYQDSKYYTEGVAEGEIVNGYIGNIARRKPMLVTNVAVSGSTLAGSDQYALINRYQDLDMGDYDYITVEYGINDFGNNVVVGTAQDAPGTGTFAACLKTIIEYALNQNPIVGLIICTDPDVRGTTTNQNGNTLKDYADVMLEIAKQYRLPVCDWFYRSGINSITRGDGTSRYYLTQSGTHPSVYGHMRMGAMLNQVFDSLLC